MSADLDRKKKKNFCCRISEVVFPLWPDMVNTWPPQLLRILHSKTNVCVTRNLGLVLLFLFKVLLFLGQDLPERKRLCKIKEDFITQKGVLTNIPY